MAGKKRTKLHGKVQKVIQAVHPNQPSKAQIGIEEADELYREIRIDNVMTDSNGKEVSLKPGADVDVIVEADSNATIKLPQS
jgi:hypothetical protein